MNRLFHRWIYTLDAMAGRLLELPTTLLLLGGLVAFVGSVLLARVASKRARGWLRADRVLFLATLGAVAMVSLVFDRRLERTQVEVRRLTSEMKRAASRPEVERLSAAHRLMLRDVEARRDAPELQGVDMAVSSETSGILYVLLSAEQPDRFLAHVAIVDLKTPRLEIQVTPELGAKVRLSQFAAEHDIIVGVNGEAGRSVAPDAEFGAFVGTWVARGSPVMLEDSARRPFIKFDEHNRAAYVREEIVDNEPGPDKYNAHYCRYDSLLDGKVRESYETIEAGYGKDKAPRTLIGLGRDPSRLFMMVVDGRLRGYSDGLSVVRAADLLKGLGAHNAMHCDQGGSSAMWLRSHGGIANSPASVDGRDRPTYNNFGISIRAERAR